MTSIRTTLLLAGVLGLAAPAFAQTPAHDNAAAKPVHTVNDGGARPGANSFTQAQAREHIAKSGFAAVSALAKDKNGVWRGTATKGGHKLAVALDFTGNVTSGPMHR